MDKLKKFTKTERSWIMYDWANSVFATNILAAIFPIYFASVCQAAGVDNVVLWAFGTSAATFSVALLAPFLGALGDHKGYKKKLFSVFLFLGVGFTAFNAFTDNYMFMLVGYTMSYIGFTGANLFYDSFMTDVTTKDRMDKVSSWGFAMGYTGGSTIAFVISIAVLLIMGFENVLALKIVLVFTSLWWLVFSIPFIKNVKQVHYIDKPTKSIVTSSLKNLVHTAKSIFKVKAILFFLLAYFFYIDGVNTVITISTSYGSTLGLDSVGMIFALLVTQIVAVPCSIIFGKFAVNFGSIKMIYIAISVYIGICLVGFFMGYNVEQNNYSPESIAFSEMLFWILAFMVGTVQGGIQAISRAYFGKLIPPERSNEYFGFFDIFGKFAAVLGPLVIANIKLLTGRDSLGVLSLVFLFILAFIFLTAGRKHFKNIAK